MNKLSSKEIRNKWIEFFESKDHLKLASASLIPHNDPTLLWINSGVATLKDYFSGKKKPKNPRIVNSQKSIRTNDIDNVGNTSRHHTFFEMLGNFSIGDYFKDEALEYALEFLNKILEMPIEKLYITYYEEDQATYDKWIKLGIKPDHLIKGNRAMNFWDLGQGPCGPDTEIFYDRGNKYDKRGIELIAQDLENDRYIEIWNIVFSQFNNDGENNYTELVQKNIDTGAGLERIAAIIQDVPTNFDTDLFMPIIKELEQISLYKYKMNNYFAKDEQQTKINKSFKIVADHMRSVVNAISDGANPSNISRGYIIRRLIRRAYRSGMQLGIKETTFLFKLVQVIKDISIFDIDVKNVSAIIQKEELLFAKTVQQGEELLIKSIIPNQEFDFAVAFKLFETYGFPIELTQEILIERGIKLDISRFEEFKKAHADASRSKVNKGLDKQSKSLTLINKLVSDFVGYEQTKINAHVVYLLNEDNEVNHLNGLGYVVFNQTPFYATSGGQRHDKGFIMQNGLKLEVLDVFKDKYNNHVHKVKGILNKGPVQLVVNEEVRLGLERNHSGTHLLFCALREVLGNHIKQLGSDNNEERLTFDFPNETKPTDKQIKKIEELIQSYIKLNSQREYLITTINEAEKMGVIMTLEEQEYMDPKNVRVVKFPKITSDLCGGTHLSNTSKLENFKVVSVDNKGSGIYRIKAISSNKLVDEYLISEIDKYKSILRNVIIKNIKLNKAYNYSSNFYSNIKIPKIKLSNSEKDFSVFSNKIEFFNKVKKPQSKTFTNFLKIIKNNFSKPNINQLVILEKFNGLKKFKEFNVLKYLMLNSVRKAREDNKKLQKLQSKVTYDLENIIFNKVNNIDLYIDLVVKNPASIKSIAISLREKYPNALFVIGAQTSKELIVVASKKNNANKIIQSIFANHQGSGGGSPVLAQGACNLSDTLKADIIKIVGEYA